MTEVDAVGVAACEVVMLAWRIMVKIIRTVVCCIMLV